MPHDGREVRAASLFRSLLEVLVQGASQSEANILECCLGAFGTLYRDEVVERAIGFNPDLLLVTKYEK